MIARKTGLRFAALFLFVFFLLQTAYSASSAARHAVIDVLTVMPSAAIIDLIDPESNAVPAGHRIVSPQGSLSILNGCEGTETFFLLSAAMLAFSAGWKRKMSGIVSGLIVVYLLNQCRIISLFFAARENHEWFDLLHGYVAPTLIIALSAIYFLWWANEAAD